MSTGATAAIVLVAVAIGGFFLYEATKPAAKTTLAPNTVMGATGLINAGTGLIGALSKAFGSGSSSNMPGSSSLGGNYDPSFFTSNLSMPTDTAAQASYASSHGVLDVTGNTLTDLNTGNAVVYGTD
jgi:hypothetical protein